MSAQASRWIDTAGAPITHAALLSRVAQSQVVLLGEHHDRPDHHRWQLHVAAGLAALRPVVLGFEMFPARLDPVLAEWVAGGLSEPEFLARAEWPSVWGFPPELYLPLFRFCRECTVPMVGLNVARSLVRAVGAGGWESVPEDQREGLTVPSPSPLPYRRFIFELTGGPRPDRTAQSPEDPAFDRFVRAQEVWDRAFATHIRAALRRPGAPLVIGIMGMGHVQFGGGVPWQLADLGITRTSVLIPRDRDQPFRPGAADAAYLLPPVLEVSAADAS
ncbi:MAG TPA: ChaN family lipoprotein [Paracoccus solventivorans]|uniref:ChaN family lipoprotein n=1 Tax=Paracoccus solventivorans TaxID=53463 RepID=A0A832QWA5_9RHOB|nr:ChaN family lipoprotein [Paracoccus solventivorans]HHW33631.1 ChaN family lipoprotein [Paracoccus solventivorans]